MPLVNTKEMFKKAQNENYAIGAFNIINMEVTQGIATACNKLNSPVILQISESARTYAGTKYINGLVKSTVNTYRHIPVALHLDHGKSFEVCKNCIDNGFTSVMIDGSHLPYKENIALTKSVVKYAHEKNVTVEGELGRLAGIEDEDYVEDAQAFYTNPEQAKDFVESTNVDSLAISVGTSHGVYKFFKGRKSEIQFDILEKIQKNLGDFPLVLHGTSSIEKRIVDKINQFGGEIKKAVGLPEEILKKAVTMGVCKMNVDSDLRLVMTASIREYLSEICPSGFDPRGYLGYARNKVEDIVIYKIDHILNSKNKI